MATAFGGDDALAAGTTREGTQQRVEVTMHIEFAGESAIAERASALRVALSKWLTDLHISPDRAYDVVLAAYEAMANAVEHAYESDSEPGTLDLHAQCVPSTGWVEVTVADRGEWAVHPPDSTRGKGVPLMHALADSTAVTTDSRGTTVRMVWNALTAE